MQIPILGTLSETASTKPGDFQGFCETTETARYFNPLCKCLTYAGNLGPCRHWEEGQNGRCVYCDHHLGCHLNLDMIIYAKSQQ